MPVERVRAALLALVLALVTACAAPPEPTPSTVAPSQAAVLAAVVDWLRERDLGEQRGRIVYVDENLGAQPRFFAGEHQPELLDIGPAAFGDRLSAEGRAAIATVMSAVAVAEFVADRGLVVDRAGPDHLGCRPLIGGRTLLSLGVWPRGGTYLAEVNLEANCQGRVYLLEVALVGGRFVVTRVVGQGSWIV